MYRRTIIQPPGPQDVNDSTPPSCDNGGSALKRPTHVQIRQPSASPPPAQSATLFSAKAPDGSQWSFDPENGKWTVEQNGQKAASAKFEAIQAKRSTWAKQASAKAATREPIELNLMMLTLPPGNLFARRGEQSPAVAFPVQIKADWDPDKGHVRGVKYRVHDDKSSGWKNWDNRDLVVFDPSNIPAEVTAVLQEGHRHQLLAATATKAEHQIAELWQSQKQNTAQTVTIDKSGVVPTDYNPNQSAFSRRDHIFALSSNWPITIRQQDTQTSGWVQDQDGAWTAPGASARVRLVPPQDVHSQSPKFVLEDLSAATPHMLYETSDVLLALSMLRATIDLDAMKAPSVTEWHAHGDWLQKGRPSWPKSQTTRHALFLQSPSGSDVLFLLGHENAVPQDDEDWSSSYNAQKAQLQWRKHDGLRYSQVPMIFSAGPEDVLLDRLKLLCVDRDAVLRPAPLPPAPSDHDVPSPNAPARTRGDLFSAMTAPALEEAYAKTLNGDAQPTIEELKIQWDLRQASLLKQAQSHPDISSWSTQCTRALEECASLLASTKMAPPAKTPKR